MTRAASRRALALHLAVLALLFALQFVLPAYHHASLARILVLAAFAVGYNLLMGYTGLLSLGHAMFFAAGLYGAGLTVHHLGFGVPSGFLAGCVAAFLLALAIGAIALRTTGVFFMIVTLMFAQAGFLTALYFNEITRGDEGFVLAAAARVLDIGGQPVALSEPNLRYNLALAIFAACLLVSLVVVRSSFGRTLVAVRENEERTRLLGYNTFLYKLAALALSGAMSGAAGAAYALLFGYVGATFAAIQYSIFPLLWVLLGGVGTTLGPLIGTVLMFYLVDVSSEYTTAYMIVVGAALVLLVMWFPRGILGTVRQRWAPWLP
ncbi:MAG: branched-chain amino acid ABC transporter permease [Alphaproteobacteria bacterium]|nr:branched-chain amino acid ABC transporter permease [Alphaproteobacteria bacterium]